MPSSEGFSNLLPNEGITGTYRVIGPERDGGGFIDRIWLFVSPKPDFSGGEQGADHTE
jgi:hypothetical protein